MRDQVRRQPVNKSAIDHRNLWITFRSHIIAAR
jgi:hypothetical protein